VAGFGDVVKTESAKNAEKLSMWPEFLCRQDLF